MSDARVVLLTQDGVGHRYVARTLAQEFPSLRLIVEEGAGGNTGKSMRRAWKRGIGTFIDKIGRTVFLKMIRNSEARHDALVAHLGSGDLACSIYEQAVRVRNVNDEEAVEQLGRWNPELVLVYGTGLVRSKVFDAVSCPVLNLHTGLSPYYRGVACHLWPVAEGRLDRVGFPVHDCVAKLDAGGILSTGVVDVMPGDSIHDVFARQVHAGGPEYARCAVAELSDPLPRSVQDLELGREYMGSTLGLNAEWRARRRLRRLKRDV